MDIIYVLYFFYWKNMIKCKRSKFGISNEIIVNKGQEVDPKKKMIQSQGICRCDIDGKNIVKSMGAKI
jgi:hypothetical protein